MTKTFIMIVGVALFFGVTAVWALVWAVRSGQFQDFGGAARSIFDEEEPVGEVTDRFPEHDQSSDPSRKDNGQ